MQTEEIYYEFQIYGDIEKGMFCRIITHLGNSNCDGLVVVEHGELSHHHDALYSKSKGHQDSIYLEDAHKYIKDHGLKLIDKFQFIVTNE